MEIPSLRGTTPLEGNSPGDITPAGTKRPSIATIKYSHDALIDAIIANPQATQGQLAAHFGYSGGWVSTIMASSVFRDRLAERRGELIDPSITASIEERFRALTERSLQVLQEKLSAPVVSIPDNLALRAAELGAKAMGVGGNAPTPPPPADHLSKLSERLILLQRSIQAQVVDGEVC